MKVWTIFLYDYEATRILGVYASEESAKNALVQQDKEDPYAHWLVNGEIKQWEVL